MTDPSGAAVGGAEIIVTANSTGVKFNTRSSETGNYVVNALPFGTYTANVSSAGFRQLKQPRH